MPFTTSPYATRDQVKSSLDLQSTQYDSWIDELLLEAQAAIDAEIGYPFQTDGSVGSPATRIYSGNDKPQIWVDDCIQIVQVLEDASRDITTDVVLGPSNRSPGYLLRRLSGQNFIFGINNYTVRGVFGQPAIPADITRATIRLTGHYFMMRGTSYADRISEQGNIRVIYTKEIPKDIMQIIRRYKRTLALTRSR